MRSKRITRNVAYTYDCNVCDERFVGYGDNDPKLKTWLDRHNNWHTQGIQEAGRHTLSNPPPSYYGAKGNHSYTMEA